MEIRKNNDNSIRISGYVNAALRESRVLQDKQGPFVEMVDAGTWARAIRNNPNVGVMFNHSRPVEARNLELYEDCIGAKFSADIYDEEIIAAAERRELTGFSFGFNALQDEWSVRADGMRSRMLKEIRLHEVSILNVTPAYIATTIEARDGEAKNYEVRYEEFESAAADVVEDKGISRMETPDQECREDMPEETADEQCAVEDDGKAAFDACLANATIELLKFGGK